MKAITLTNYPIEYFLPNLTPERQEEILRIINNLERPTLDDGKTITNFLRNPETNYLFFHERDPSIEDHMLQYHQKHIFEKSLTPEEWETCNTMGYEKWQANNEQRRFDKARKIPVSEWNGPIFDHSGEYHNSVNEFYEDLSDNYEEDDESNEGWMSAIPDYVYGSKSISTLENDTLSSMIYDQFERHSQNMEESFDDPKIPDYLQEAWEKFVKEESDTYYMRDDSTIILLK